MRNYPVITTGLALRFGSVLIAFVQLPIVAESLGPNRFATYLMLIAVPATVSFIEAGIGNSSLNHMLRREKTGLSSNAIFAASLATSLVGLSLILLPAIVGADLTAKVFGLQSASIGYEDSSIQELIRLSLSLCGLNVVANLSQRLLWSQNSGTTANIILLCQNLFSLIGVYTLGEMTNPTLDKFLLVQLGSPIAFGTIAFAFVNRNVLSINATSMQEVGSACRVLWADTWRFSSIAIMSAIAYSLDLFIAAHFLGVTAVTPLALLWRVFSLIPSTSEVFLKASQLEYAELLNRKSNIALRIRLINDTKRYLIVSAAAAIMTLGMSPYLIMFLSSTQQPQLDPRLLVACFLLAIALTAGGPMSAFLNAALATAPVLRNSVKLAALNLGIALILTPYIGVSGPIWASFVGQIAIGIYGNWKIVLAYLKVVNRD